MSLKICNIKEDQVQLVICSEISERNWDLPISHIKNLISLLDLQNITGLSSVQISISLELKMPFPDEAQACSDYFTENIYKKGKTFNNGFIKK